MLKKITLAVLLLLMVGGAILQNIYVNNATEELTKDLERVKSALDADDYTAAAAAADEFMANWDREKDKFEAFFEHKEVDSISASAKSIQSLCYSGSKKDALSRIAEEMFYINHIRDIDALNWANVF
jgi:hypothetical protein